MRRAGSFIAAFPRRLPGGRVASARPGRRRAVVADRVPFQHRHGTLLPQPRQLGVPKIAPHDSGGPAARGPRAGDLPRQPCVEPVVRAAEDVGDGVEVGSHKFLERDRPAAVRRRTGAGRVRSPDSVASSTTRPPACSIRSSSASDRPSSNGPPTRRQGGHRRSAVCALQRRPQPALSRREIELDSRRTAATASANWRADITASATSAVAGPAS